MQLKIIFLACLTLFKFSGSKYVNNLRAPFSFECPENQHISYIGSVHDDRPQGKFRFRNEDRLWDLQCRSSGTTVQCAISGYINDFDGVMNFTCTGNQVLTGLTSEFDSFYKDRKFRTQCCAIQGKTPTNCQWSDFVNEFDKPMSFPVARDQVIIGLYSVHENFYEDRRWKFLICQI